MQIASLLLFAALSWIFALRMSTTTGQGGLPLVKCSNADGSRIELYSHGATLVRTHAMVDLAQCSTVQIDLVCFDQACWLSSNDHTAACRPHSKHRQDR